MLTHATPARLALVIVLGCNLGYTATIQVPAGQATIQGAIVAAASGDTIVVAPGTYAENLNFLGKDITVRSSGGPTVTIVDGSLSGPVVQFITGEGPAAVLEGFTIQHGRISGGLSTGGAGVRCVGASPTIRGNVIKNNVGEFLGAGVYLDNSFALVTENAIHSNLFQCQVVDSGCGIGGGIYSYQGAPTISFNEIYDNLAENAGGGIFCYQPVDADIINNIVRDNSGGSGGGIQIDGGGASLVNNRVTNNLAIGFVTIAGLNPGPGGGVYFTASAQGEILGCTIAENECPTTFGPTNGGGILAPTTNVTVKNTIVWGNLASTAPQIDTLGAVTYTLVEGGYTGVGNLASDPLFIFGFPGEFLLSQSSAGQGSTSPAVDAGDPQSPVPPGTTRTDGVVDAGIADLGFHYVTVATAPIFDRGDCNADGTTNIADAVFLLASLFPPPGAPPAMVGCQDACDANDDDALNISDAVRLLNALFGPATPLPSPYGSCGIDPTHGVLDCVDHEACMPT
ncbi:MAG: hypothetical protein AAF581_08565 [Planctomycetota bacterium]